MSLPDGKEKDSRKQFSKRQTKILKGIAVGMLLVHHGLAPIPQESLGTWESAVANSISLSKLCVAVFTVLSGYGMYVSFREKEEAGCDFRSFVFSHIFKVYRVFWLAALLSIGLTALIKGNFMEIYEGYPLYYFLLDVMGLSYPAKTPKFVNSWWYMTAILLYYCLFPLLFRLAKKLKRGNYLLLAVMAAAVFCFPGTNSVIIYGCFFFFGMIFAERDLFNRFLNCLDENRLQTCLKLEWYLLVMILLGIFRQTFLAGTKTEYYLDWLIALVLIVFVSELSIRIEPAYPGILELTGSYSFEIYLLHGMFIKYYGSYVYGDYGCLGVLLRILAASFLGAAVMKWMEKRLCFGKAPVSKAMAGVLVGTVLFLMLPKLIANIGIGKLAFYKEQITMENGTWYVPLYRETPLFWELADKSYRSEKRELVIFVNGVLYSHDTGETKVTVALPFGKSVSCMVSVE